MYIEHGVCVDFEAEGALNIMCESLFVALLDGGPLFLEHRLIDILQKALQPQE